MLDLFSGIGAFSLGLERAGFRTLAFCEVDPFCRRVLAKHWPEVPCYDDVRSLTAERLRADGISVDAICGGFPCQDISVAGRGVGIGGERSGLWSEFVRIIGEVGPRYVLVENVAALLGRGLGTVLGDLAALGFDAEWHCIPASAVGAPHRRDRVWIIAHDAQQRWGDAGVALAGGGDGIGWPQVEDRGLRCDVADATRLLGNGRNDNARSCCESTVSVPEPGNSGGALRDPWRIKTARHRRIVGAVSQSDWWLAEPNVGRVAHGVPDRVHRLRSLGNSLVPQIPELIGRAIIALDAK